MKKEILQDKDYLKTRKYAISSAIIWTLIIISLWYWENKNKEDEALNRAYTYAEIGYDKDIIYHKWIAEHDRIYIKIDSTISPMLNLSHIPNMGIIIDSTLKFTLINPAYITHQVYELQEATSNFFGHLTSLKSISPENTPAYWKEKALNYFENGELGYFDIDTINVITF